jgi:hypothetical protein
MLLGKLELLMNVYLHTRRPKNSDGRHFRLITSYKTGLCINSHFRKNNVEHVVIFVHVRKFVFDFSVYKSGNVQIVTNQSNHSC